MKKDAHAPTYRSWQMMKNRCLNTAAQDFKYYGGRGITIHPTWTKFEMFVTDMGLRPPGMTIDRQDTNGGYNPKNCRWATRETQARNRDYTLDLCFDGRTQKVWEWADDLRIKPTSVHLRLWRFRTGQISWADVFKPNNRGHKL